jgi:hypothetical protein
MPRPQKIVLNLAAVPNTVSGANYDLTHFVADYTSNGYTFDNTVTSDGQAHIVSVQNNDATDHSGLTITFTGTDVQGNAQTETITGPGPNAIVVSTKYYKTLTSAFLSGSIAPDSFDIGIKASVESIPIPPDYRGTRARVTIETDVTSYELDYTSDNVWENNKSDWIWKPQANQVNNVYDFDIAPVCFRVLITAYNTNNSMIIEITQSEK